MPLSIEPHPSSVLLAGPVQSSAQVRSINPTASIAQCCVAGSQRANSNRLMYGTRRRTVELTHVSARPKSNVVYPTEAAVQFSPMHRTITRELRIAFSAKAQPVWLRVTKWVVLIGVAIVLRKTPYIWLWVLGLPSLGIIVHFIYRWKTNGWTRPWGGWNDTDAGKL